MKNSQLDKTGIRFTAKATNGKEHERTLSWFWHGKNVRQCWYEPSCFTCYVKTIFVIFRVAWRIRKEKGVQRKKTKNERRVRLFWCN